MRNRLYFTVYSVSSCQHVYSFVFFTPSGCWQKMKLQSLARLNSKINYIWEQLINEWMKFYTFQPFKCPTSTICRCLLGINKNITQKQRKQNYKKNKSNINLEVSDWKTLHLEIFTGKTSLLFHALHVSELTEKPYSSPLFSPLLNDPENCRSWQQIAADGRCFLATVSFIDD